MTSVLLAVMIFFGICNSLLLTFLFFKSMDLEVKLERIEFRGKEIQSHTMSTLDLIYERVERIQSIVRSNFSEEGQIRANQWDSIKKAFTPTTRKVAVDE